MDSSIEDQMGTREWKSVLGKLTIVGGVVYPVKRSVLREFEQDSGMVLPKSYKGYCQVFGPGILAPPWGYRIHTPQALSPRCNLEALNQSVKGMAVLDSAVDPQQLRRAVFFASDMATSDYFWDPEDVTIDGDAERGVYVLYRSLRVVRLCGTFWEFVNDICLGAGVPGYDNSERVEPEFTPME